MSRKAGQEKLKRHDKYFVKFSKYIVWDAHPEHSGCHSLSIDKPCNETARLHRNFVSSSLKHMTLRHCKVCQCAKSHKGASRNYVSRRGGSGEWGRWLAKCFCYNKSFIFVLSAKQKNYFRIPTPKSIWLSFLIDLNKPKNFLELKLQGLYDF